MLVTVRSERFSDSGLFLVTPSGQVTRILRSSWTPVAVGGHDGPFAVETRRSLRERRPLVVVNGAGSSEIRGSTGARCISWSPGGRMLSYLTGTVKRIDELSTRSPVWGMEGALWVVDIDAVSDPQAIETGFFPVSECPSWSPRGIALAYIVRRVGASAGWSMAVWRGGRREAVAELDVAIPSYGYRTFDWLPRTQRLRFLEGNVISEWADNRVIVLTEPGALATVGAPGTDRLIHSIRFNPVGTLLAVSIGGETAIFNRAGTRVRLVAGTFNGWSGNDGILTMRAERRVITVRLHGIGSGGSRVIARGFKSGIATDPAGAWFAYANWKGDPAGTRFVYFRRPDGSLLKMIRFAQPWIVAGVARDGRIAEPTSAY